MAARMLMLVVRYGSAKNYVLPAFERMLNACVAGTPGLDLVIAGDQPDDAIPIPPGLFQAADICRIAREATRVYAREEGYDKMIWQGVDALWQSREDFERILSRDVPIVGPLICGRTNTGQACARRFHRVKGKIVQQQYDVPNAELKNAHLVEVGWPGMDNTVFDRSVLDIGIMANCPEWYEQDNESLGRPQGSQDDNAEKGNLDHTEWFTFAARKRGLLAYVDTGVKVWHVHETGAPDGGPLARMWPDIEVPLSELSW